MHSKTMANNNGRTLAQRERACKREAKQPTIFPVSQTRHTYRECLDIPQQRGSASTRVIPDWPTGGHLS